METRRAVLQQPNCRTRSTRPRPRHCCAKAGLPVPPGRRAGNAAEAVAAASALGFPVALKALGIAHKSEHGAVRLDLRDEAAVRDAAAALSGLGTGLYVERMVTGGVAELIVGVTSDPIFGPVMTIGSGGVLVELLKDSATLLLPATRADIEAALRGLKLFPLLDGFRGRPKADLDATIDAISGIADFAVANARRDRGTRHQPADRLRRGRGRLDRRCIAGDPRGSGNSFHAQASRPALAGAVVRLKEHEMSEVITTRREGGILEVTLDRPKANAIDLVTSRLMGETFRAFRDDPELRVAIVRTAGDKFFCAGWDLKAAAGGDAVDGDYGVGGFGGLQELRDLNKPVIAAVNGMAVGGGFELALSCDLIYAADHSSFALPEIRAGTLADAATVKLPKRIPYHVAMDLLLTGRWMDVRGGASLGPGQRGAAEGQARGSRLGDRPPARLRAAAGLRGDQGSGARGRIDGLPGSHELDHQAQVPHGRRTLRLGRRPGRFSRLRGKARSGVEGAVERCSD